MTRLKFMILTNYLNRAEVSRGLGMNRMYITDIRHGKTTYTKKIGKKLLKLLNI
jgi:ribosome-binding protein aMBF1 (putative translation factor)